MANEVSSTRPREALNKDSAPASMRFAIKTLEATMKTTSYVLRPRSHCCRVCVARSTIYMQKRKPKVQGRAISNIFVGK